MVEKISFYILIVTRGVKYTFDKLSAKYINIGVCVILSCILVFISGNVKRFEFMSDVRLVVCMYAVAVLLLPVTILIYLKRLKPYEKVSEDD